MSPDAEVLLEAAEVLRAAMVETAQGIVDNGSPTGGGPQAEELSRARQEMRARIVADLHRGWCALHAQAVALLEADS